MVIAGLGREKIFFVTNGMLAQKYFLPRFYGMLKQKAPGQCLNFEAKNCNSDVFVPSEICPPAHAPLSSDVDRRRVIVINIVSYFRVELQLFVLHAILI